MTSPTPGPVLRAVATTLVIAIVIMIGIAGCGLRQDDQPRPIAIDARTREIFDKSNGTSTTAVITAADARQLIYLVETQGTDEVLVAVARDVAPQSSTGDLARKMIEQLLMSQPDTSDLRSRIPQDTRVLAATVDGSVLDLDLSSALGAVEGDGLRLAIAQIVFTATAIPGIDFVRFSINGIPKGVPLDNETAPIGGLISRADFPKLSATVVTNTPSPTTSTTAAVPPTEPATEVVPGNGDQTPAVTAPSTVP